MIIDTVHCTELGCTCPGNRWWTGWIGPAEIHLVPIDDLEPHHFEACPCDPSIELHVAGDRGTCALAIEEAVAGGVDLPAAEAHELVPDDVVMPIEQVAPAAVSERAPARSSRRCP